MTDIQAKIMTIGQLCGGEFYVPYDPVVWSVTAYVQVVNGRVFARIKEEHRHRHPPAFTDITGVWCLHKQQTMKVTYEEAIKRL
jgi:hypothetical protein